jgi:hypothetical protein
LRVRYSTAAIASSTAREKNDCVSCSTTRIEIEASLGLERSESVKELTEKTYQAADNQHCSSLVIMFPSGDDIPLLAGTPITISDLDWGQIGSKVSR